MPEIKNVFRSGIMNKDDDERIIPNGQYRDAMNVEVATSEGSDVGTVQNILGNVRVEDVIGNEFKCVGAIADEKNNVLYWFVTSKNLDAIIEYHDDGTVTYILIDLKGDVLKFDKSNIITGINIIDNLLFWTDNINEPKKINIDTFKLNPIVDLTIFGNVLTHSNMYVNGGSVGPVTEDHITVIRKRPNKAPKIKFEDTVVQRQYDFGNALTPFGGPIDISNGTGLLPLVGDPLVLGHTSNINYFHPFEYGVDDIILLSRDTAIGNLPQNYELKLRVVSPNSFYNSGINEGRFISGFEILEINSAIPVNQSFVYNAQKLTEDKPLFETEFVRFATRYKYADGEYSAFSPFTQPVFLTGSYGFHPTKHPHNLGMENKIVNLKLQDLIPLDTPTDVVQLDILFKKESSTTVYSIDSIKPTDPGSPNNWNTSMDTTILSTSWTNYNDDNNTFHTTSNGGYTGEYFITTENIYAALPANQTLRPWDNVPRKALAQEITANRLIYGNYIQNYDLIDYLGDSCYVDTTLDYEVRGFQENNVVDFLTGKKSIKSDRTYYLGVVYGDEYGRETPVFTGKDSSINIPFDLDSGPGFDGAGSNSLRLKVRLKGPQPEWAHYYKYFIKQTTGEYYNLVVDRVYKSVQDQSLWLSLPSSDVNKLKEEDYFTIKKQVNVETQVPVENKIKVIDIKNEAPDSIKFDYTTLGTGGGGEDDLAALFPDSNGRPAEDVARIAIDKETWIETEFGANLDDYTRSDKFAMQFSIKQNGNNTFSEMYFVSTAYEEDAGVSGRYIFILSKKITAADSWVESSPGILNATDRLTVELFVLEEKNAIEFEGRFFVKIASNPITQTYLIPSANNIADNILTARVYPYWLADKNTMGNVTGSVSGVFNATSTWVNNTFALHSSPTTNEEIEWAKVLKFDTEAESSSGWFIDNLAFISAQGPFEVNNVWDASFSGRMTKGDPLIPAQQVNGLEGIVEANYDPNTLGPYRLAGSKTWRKRPSILNGAKNVYLAHPDDTGSALDYTNTYEPTNDYNGGTKGIFMHFSFSSCGVDLHDGDFGDDDSLLNDGSNGNGSGFKKSLQWIASSSIHHNGDPLNAIGSSFSSFNANVTAVGLEAHDAQFDPVYTGGPSASSIINSLTTGSQFKIEGDDTEVYTIQGVDIKYLYNHTPWNPMPVSGSSGSIFDPRTSVSQAFDDWRGSGYEDQLSSTREVLKQKIVDFGKANNRRVVYIVQLDKDPREGNYNILDTADVDTFNAINFIDTYIQPGSNTLPTSPAILETEAKEDQDLNIYFEVTDALPRILDLTDGTGATGLTSDYPIGAFGSKVDAESVKGHLLAPVGSRVTVNNASGDPGEADYSLQNAAFPDQDFYLRVAAWDGNILTLESPGLEAFAAGTPYALPQSNVYYGESTSSPVNPHKTLTFWREDGSYTKGAIFSVREVDASNNYVTKVELFPLCHNRDTGLGYYNCFSFGNGVESNRIRDDFNASTIRNGVKASTTLEEPYAEERRKYGLIYSGLYNSTSGVNNLNQFIQAEKITKDVNPIYGSIQKLYARDKDLVTLCEDKILKIFVDRDVLYNADGKQQLLATNNVLGSIQPFSGNYGISKNPESFAAESFRSYFTDKQRGAVLRLSMDGLTAISDAGMHDFFRDNLKDGELLYGSYDAYKKNYNLTINYGDNTGKTISFSEKSKGWTSLKSFIPEVAISSVNQYYTMNFGQLWKHHQEFELDGTTVVDRNTFYGVFEDSSITPVLNTQPEVVKNFNTLNYEGSQSKVDMFTIDPVTGLTDGQYYNLELKKGWYVEDIRTDKQEGVLNEFIEKEGKWFNYIKGKTGEIDTAAFNFQGLGIVANDLPFEIQLRQTDTPSATNGAARVVYAGTNTEATGLTYIWSNGGTSSEVTGLSTGAISLILTDNAGIVYNFTVYITISIVNGCTDPTATNYNYSANLDDGTCTI